MGWCSGTETFDVAVKMVLDEELSAEEKIERLINAWWKQDWDCEGDSQYWNHPIVQPVFRRLAPAYFDDGWAATQEGAGDE